MRLILTFAFSATAAASQEPMHVLYDGPRNEEFRVGKNGEVKISQDVTIGDVLVNKGKYLLSHRVEGDYHFLVLTRIETKNGAKMPGREIRTPLKASTRPAKHYTLFAYQLANRSYRITLVQIAGEDWDHILP